MPDELARWYRGRVVFGPFAPVDPPEISALEDEIGCALPPAYRSFLEVANGGTLPYSARVPPAPDGEPISYSGLFRVGRDRHGGHGPGTLLGEYRRLPNHWLAEHLPVATLLPIARTPGGDLAFVDLAPGRYGQVAGFVHGLPAWTGLRTQNMSGVLADAFDSYLDGLFIDAELAEDVWSDNVYQDPAGAWQRVIECWLDDGMPGWRAQPWAGSN